MLHTTSALEVPADILENWQETLNILAEIIKIPAVLIMRHVDQDIEVLVSSKSEGNPYHPGERTTLFGSGLYCETVIKTQDKLLVPDALADAHWRNNPDVKLNMISYLGVPLLLPDKKPFGTLCVLDNKANEYSQVVLRLVEKFRDMIESELRMIFIHNELLARNKKILEAKTREAMCLYRDLASRIPGGFYVMRLDLSGKRAFEFVSKQLCEMFATQEEDALADYTVIHDSIHPEDRPGIDAADRMAAQSLQPFHWEGRIIVRGETRWIRVQSNPLKISKEESLWNGIVIDLTDEIVQRNELLERVCTDALTGVLARHQFFELGDQVLKESRMFGSSLGVAMVDIDHFKAINDTYGHSAGDIILKRFGQLAKSHFRPTDLLGRIGGDEFGIVLTRTGSSEAMSVMQRFRMVIENTTVKYQDTTITFTISCGICASSCSGDMFQQLLNRADQALYKAKEQGRNQVVAL